MTKLTKVAASVAASLILTAGVVGIAGASASNSGTGPDSSNKNISKMSSSTHVTNSNKLHVGNSNSQAANSGNADVKHNTTGGDATTGDTANNNGLNVSVTSNNSGSVGGSGALGDSVSTDPSGSNSNTGPDSNNVNIAKSTVKTTIKNTNDLYVTNTNSQSASSGNAKVTDNTTGGNATTGNSTNTNTTTVSLDSTN